MSSSELSELSSPLSSDNEIATPPLKPKNLDHYFQNVVVSKSSPPAKKRRPPSPPHEYVLADNPDVAFICMFRSRFSAAFPKHLPHYGPQDIEQGVVENPPGESVERLLCALLGLVLNRKKDIERGHYQRALEEAIQAHAGQWPPKWSGKNPLHGGGSFNNMSPTERLTLLSAAVYWSLGSSEAVQNVIKDSYKQQRHDDDLNQPLSVQPWGRDGDKRRYWLIEGQDDTTFRLYRENNPALKHRAWRSVAGSIDELRDVAKRLGEDGAQVARRLEERIQAGIPRFEIGEEKRKRREYRNARKAQFTRPEPGFSLYEGRTRGKRMKYTFSDEEDGGSDTPSTRRSNRQSGLSTPAEPARPTVTASGRQVKSRIGGSYGEIMHSKQNGISQQPLNRRHEVDDDMDPLALPSRLRRDPQKSSGGQDIGEYDSLDEMDDESDTSSSGHDWDGEDDNDRKEDDDDEDDDEGMSDGLSGDFEGEGNGKDDDLQSPRSLVVSLRYHPNTDPPKQTTLDTDEWKATADELSGQAPPPEANPFANLRDAGLVPTTPVENFSPIRSNSTLPMQNHIEFPQEPKTKPTDHSLPIPSNAI